MVKKYQHQIKIEVISSDYQGEGRYYKYDIKIPQIKDESSEDLHTLI